MTTALQKHLRATGLPDHFTLDSFRVGGSLSQSLAGTHVDAIMEMDGRKTRRMAEYYVGATCSGPPDVTAEQPLDAAYRESDAFSLTPEFQANYAACGQKKYVWVKLPLRGGGGTMKKVGEMMCGWDHRP